jgi:hypothetical protein
MSLSPLLSTIWRGLLDRLLPRRKLLADIRSKWGKPGNQHAWRSSTHFDLTRDARSTVPVDDKTWLDLEFPKIFSEIDTTITPMGRQYLFSMMRSYAEGSVELGDRQTCAEMLRTNDALRENIQLALTKLADDSHADMADFIFGDPPRAVSHLGLLLLWSVFCLVTLVAAILSVWPAWMLVGTFAINLIIMARTFGSLRRDTEALKHCLSMLPVAAALSQIRVETTVFKPMGQLREEAPLRKKVQKRLRWLSLFQWDVVQYVSLWLNIAFLAELVAYTRALRHFGQVRSTLQSTWELLGSIDAAVAIASCLQRCPEHCVPDISSAALIDIRDGYHPLLTSPVRNSLCLDGRSALIAGSNMAGKTTLIKMVGINIILGRTLGFCLASRATIPQSSVMASIRSEHSVESGKSHYFGEIERLKAFIEAAGRSCRVFVIDELFSGTNTIERIAIARAVLEQLSTDAQVLVTTHDVELQQDLSEDYSLYHFQENPDIEGFFDYKLMPGAAVERNAIRLLARIGFPEKVVARAMDFVARQSG